MENFRTSGEKYLTMSRLASSGKATKKDQNNLKESAKYFEEEMLHAIYAVSDLLAQNDKELSSETIASIGIVINELTMLAFDAMETKSNY